MSRVFGPFASTKRRALQDASGKIATSGPKPVSPVHSKKLRERSLETSSFHDIIEAVNVQPMPDGIEHPNRIVSS